jgi:hypothetical protein
MAMPARRGFAAPRTGRSASGVKRHAGGLDAAPDGRASARDEHVAAPEVQRAGSDARHTTHADGRARRLHGSGRAFRPGLGAFRRPLRISGASAGCAGRRRYAPANEARGAPQHHARGRARPSRRAACARGSASSTPCTSRRACSSTTTSAACTPTTSAGSRSSAPSTPSPERYHHNRTGEDNADAHLKRQVMGREVVVAITDGKLDFGPWEQIFYGEFDGRRRRSACSSRSSASDSRASNSAASAGSSASIARAIGSMT